MNDIVWLIAPLPLVVALVWFIVDLERLGRRKRRKQKCVN